MVGRICMYLLTLHVIYLNNVMYLMHRKLLSTIIFISVPPFILYRTISLAYCSIPLPLASPSKKHNCKYSRKQQFSVHPYTSTSIHIHNHYNHPHTRHHVSSKSTPNPKPSQTFLLRPLITYT